MFVHFSSLTALSAYSMQGLLIFLLLVVGHEKVRRKIKSKLANLRNKEQVNIPNYTYTHAYAVASELGLGNN